jgi:DNA polymerase-3 subunit epsilon
MVLGNGREQGESSVVWIENGTYKGFGFFDDSEQGSDPEELKKYIKKYPDNRDIQRILNAYLRNNKQYKIIPLNKFQSSLFG